MSRDPYDQPLSFGLVGVSVEEYGLSRFLVIHRRWCACARDRASPARRWHHLQVHDLRDLLQQVWPHDAPPGFATRDLARRCAVAACAPPLPIHPYHRTLMKEHNTMGKIPVLACPDATGKFIVHDPACGHAARIRAAKNGTGQHRTVASLVDLVRDLYPATTLEQEGLDMVMDQDFEIRDCTPLPVEPLSDDEPLDKQVERAVLRAYSALVALHTTAGTVDAERARDAARRLEQRLASTSLIHRPAANLTITDVRDHLVASSECTAWAGVRQAAEDGLPDDANDLERAKRWVATARAMVVRLERQWRNGMEEGGTAMGRAFHEAEVEGRRRFVTRADDALHEVMALVEQHATL